MPTQTFFPLQMAFNAGELSGRMSGRMDQPVYKVGLAFCENFEPLPQGPLRMRAGSMHAAQLGASAVDGVRLLAARMISEEDYTLVLTNLLLQVFSPGGAVPLLGVVSGLEGLVNPSFDTGATAWTSAGNLTFTGGTCVFRVMNGQTVATISQAFTPSAAASAMLKVAVKGMGGVGYMALRLKDAAGTYIWNATINAPVASPTVFSAQFDLTAQQYTVEISLVFTGSGIFDTASLTLDSVSMVLDTGTASGGNSLPSPWTADQLASLHYAVDAASGRVTITHPNVRPWILAYNQVDQTWTFGPITFTNAPAEWTGVNWPGTVEIHDGRAWYSGTPNEPSRFWASRSGQPFDLSTATGTSGAVLASDAMDYKNATKGVIRWICGGRRLVLGTNLGQHSVQGSGGPPLPGDIYVRGEAFFGAARTQAVGAGTRMIYVSDTKRRILATRFDFGSDGWDSKDTTFFAEHITLGSVRELHQTFTPDSVVVALLESGKLVACSFADEDSPGWWRFTLASGMVRSAALARGASGARLWAAVERNGVVYLERALLNDGLGALYLDAAIEATADANGNVSVPHLTGPVRAVMGSELVGDFDVVAGVIALGLDYAGLNVVVGLPYGATAVTLPLEGGNPAGTSQGFKVHYTDISVRVNDSAPPILNGTRAGAGRPFATPLDTVEPLVTGDLKVKNLKTEEGGKITIEQDLPFRTEVCAIYAQASTSKL